MKTKNIQDVVDDKEEQLINHLVDRFLGWRLPKDFHPDCGIMFMDVYDNGTEQGGIHEPTGTNLFTAEQAKQMFRFLLENEDGTSTLTQLVKEVEAGERERCMGLVRGSYAHPLGTKVATVLNALQDAIDPSNKDTLNTTPLPVT